MVKGAEVNFYTTLYHHNKEKSNNLLPHPLIYLIWLGNLTLVNFDTFYRNYEKREKCLELKICRLSAKIYMRRQKNGWPWKKGKREWLFDP